ncbi:chromosome condensation (RCC1) repeat, partial [Rhizoctonia solani]
MSNLHAYFHLRNLGAFRQLLDARGVSANRLPDGKSGSGPRSWSQTQVQMTALAQGGQLDHNPNMRDPLGRTVLHLACADLAPIALEFVRALLALPPGQIDVNAQDAESGWTALHRALYAGNLPAAVLLSGRSDIDVGIRDLEGMTPFDVYNATVEGTVPESSPSVPRELWVWGSNRNATLGIGSADDRGYPEAIHPPKPAELLAKLSGSARFKLIGVNDIVMSRLHTSILTDEARANLEACGFGGVGRLGTKQHTQYSFGKVAGLENQTIIRVALGLDHTLALTSGGDVLSWGMNRFHQLGYVIEQTDSPGKPIPKGKANIDSSENQVQVSPKRVVGPLRKEIVVGIAACKTASVCWTNGDLYSWGTNSGQLGYAKVAPGWQAIPRKVATVSKVVDVALSDIAMVCLLPTKDLVCFWNGAHFRIQFPQPVFPHRYQPPVNLGRIQISKITCNESAFAALTTAGEVFLFTLPDNPTFETESNPNVRPQKVWALRRRVAAVRDIALGGDGTIIVCTASGHVFVNTPKPVKGPSIASGVNTSGVGSALLSGSYRTHKYQRILGLQRVVNVAANPTGGFAALRADATIEPLIIEGRSMAEAIGGIQPYLIESRDVGHSFDLLPALEFGDEDDEEHGGILEDIILAEQLCQAVIRSRKEDGFPSTLEHHILHGADIRISGAVGIPAHRAVIAARSTVLEKVLSGKSLSQDGLVFKYSAKFATLSVSGCHALSVLVLLNYLYSDSVCPIWDHRVRSPIASSLALIKAQPGDIRLDLQRLSRVLQLPQLQFAVESIGKRTPAPTLGPDFARLFHSSQLSERPIIGGDICLELADRSVYCHSAVLRARSPFFASFFDEAEWTQKRWSDDGILVVDMKHFEWKPMDYVFRYMCCGQVDDLFDDIAFAQSVEEFIDFIFQVMSAANELMLEQLTEICSMVILRHVTLVNSVTILADASPFYCPKLKARLHNYIAVNMESLMEKRYLDDVAHDIIKELAKFVRGQQAAKQPHIRSGAWITAIMNRHQEWLAMQDFPSVVVRTVPPGRQPKLSPKLSPTIGPTSPKTPRRVSSFNLPVTPQRQNTSKQTEKTPQSDGMFVMDEEGDEPVRARDLPTATETSMVTLPQLPPVASSPGPSPKVWRGSKAERVDMRSIMADEAASSRPARSPMVRITGFDASNQPPSPSKTLQKDRTQPSSTRQSSQLATPPASASSSWRDPPASSGSPAQRSNEARPRPGEFPSLFEGNLRQRVPSTPTAPPSGPSPSSVPKPNAQQTSSAKSNRPPPQPAPASEQAFPGLGPVIVPKRATGGAESSRKRNNADAWTAPPPVPSPLPGPSGSVSFSEIQQQQHAQKVGSGAGKSKKSLLEIQAEEAERARVLQEEELARAREAEELAAEIEFMRWWNAEEARVKKEMEGNKGGGGSGGKNRRKGRGGGGKRGKSGQGAAVGNVQAAAAGSTARP